jgi:hypothetical protein
MRCIRSALRALPLPFSMHLVVLVNLALAVVARGIAVDAAVLIAAVQAVIFQDVNHASHLGGGEGGHFLLQ